jgi:hypothetical protein
VAGCILPWPAAISTHDMGVFRTSWDVETCQVSRFIDPAIH